MCESDQDHQWHDSKQGYSGINMPPLNERTSHVRKRSGRRSRSDSSSESPQDMTKIKEMASAKRAFEGKGVFEGWGIDEAPPKMVSLKSNQGRNPLVASPLPDKQKNEAKEDRCLYVMSIHWYISEIYIGLVTFLPISIWCVDMYLHRPIQAVVLIFFGFVLSTWSRTTLQVFSGPPWPVY